VISSQENPRWDLLTAELAPPAELLEKRDEQATRLAREVADAETRIVVLYGGSNSGKSEMVRNRIVPRLVEQNPDISVFYAKCKPLWPRLLRSGDSSATLAEALRRPSIVILDSFERLLDLPRDEQRSELDALFAEFGRADPAARLVLVTDARQLTGIYALERYYPEATRAKYELPSITVHDAVLSVVRSSPGVQFTDACVDALADECAELSRTSWGNTLPLVRLVHDWALERASALGVTTLDVDELRRAGGAGGILRRHVERQLESLDEANPEDADAARALLEYLAEQPGGSGAPDLSVLSRRTGIRVAVFDRVIDSLSVPGGLLRKRPFGGLRVVPPQALAIIEADVKTRADQTERVQRLVADGFRDWEESGRLLSAARFHEIHAERRYLSLSAAETRFVLQCALLQGGEESAGAAAYWLERVERPEDQLDLLLRSTFHENWNVRRRAVEILARFADDATASRRALEVAISDEDPRVRARAVRSLRDLGGPAERDKLLHEAASAHSPYRAAALAALGAFREPVVVSLLAKVVDDHDADRELRVVAIDSLRALETSDAVEALIAIALRDVDPDDRDGATTALARLRSPASLRQVLDALTTTTSLMRWTVAVLGAVFASIGLFVGVVVFAALWGSDPLLATVYAIVAGLMLGVTATMLRRQRDLSHTPGAGERFVALIFYSLNVFTILPLVHGLASFAIHRRRTAARLLWLEVLALLIWATTWYVVAPYAATESTFTRVVVVPFEYACYTAAVLVFWGSFLTDVVGVFIGSLVLREATMARRQRRAIYSQVFANAETARIAANALVRPDESVRWSPRRLLRRYGRSVPSDVLIEWLRGDSPQLRRIAHRSLVKTKREATVQGLESLWRDANPTLRRRLLRILWGAPNERSLEALDRIRAELSRPQRWRAALAHWMYPVLIWPWGARVMIVALLPTLAIILADGWRVRHTPGWSLIVALRPAADSATAQRDAEIVNALARPFFAEASAGYLLHLLPKTSPYDHTKRLHAALVTGLGGMSPAATQPFPNWEPSIARALGVYDSLLVHGDSGQRILAANVLGRTAVAPNALLAGKARTSLVTLLASKAPDTLIRSVAMRAVTAIGTLPSMARLVALDTLLDRRPQVFGGAWLNDALIAIARTTTDSVSRALYEEPDGGRRDSVIMILDSLANHDVVIRESLTQLKACDLNADGRCDWRDEALHGILAFPSDEGGYVDLVDHYADHKQLPEGVRLLEHFADSMKTNLWPRRVLASVLHERIAPTNPAAFDSSWRVMSSARGFKSYQALRTTDPATYRKLEDDYLEIALTAGRYAEVDTLAARHLADEDETPGGQYNAALFRYLAAAMRHDAALAETSLAQLDGVIARWDAKGFDNNWEYPGTLAFLQRSDLPPALKDAAIRLCKPGSWHLPDDRIALIAANRRALGSLGAQRGSANPAADRP